MTKDEMRHIVENLIGDIDFYYKGLHGSVCPFTKTNISVAYGDKAKNYNNVDAVMTDLFWGGQSLNEIANHLELA